MSGGEHQKWGDIWDPAYRNGLNYNPYQALMSVPRQISTLISPTSRHLDTHYLIAYLLLPKDVLDYILAQISTLVSFQILQVRVILWRCVRSDLMLQMESVCRNLVANDESSLVKIIQILQDTVGLLEEMLIGAMHLF